MSYTMNPHLPRLRMQAANLVIKQGWSSRQVARYTGFDHSTIVRWVAKAKVSTLRTIPTESSRPLHHPQQLAPGIVTRILQLRAERQQCAEVIHYRLTQEEITVSLSSVKRTLQRNGLTRFSQWKKWHIYPERPTPEKPGILVEIDSMQEGLPSEQLYPYVLIDVCSRWAYAKPTKVVNCRQSVGFFKQAQQKSSFPFQLIQTDHGSEFAKWFTKQLIATGTDHRHSRVRRPTDNGHVERFIRTIQQECLTRVPRSLKAWEKALPDYLNYYNTQRPHMGLEMRTPIEVVRSY